MTQFRGIRTLTRYFLCLPVGDDVKYPANFFPSLACLGSVFTLVGAEQIHSHKQLFQGPCSTAYRVVLLGGERLHCFQFLSFAESVFMLVAPCPHLSWFSS